MLRQAATQKPLSAHHGSACWPVLQLADSRKHRGTRREGLQLHAKLPLLSPCTDSHCPDYARASHQHQSITLASPCTPPCHSQGPRESVSHHVAHPSPSLRDFSLMVSRKTAGSPPALVGLSCPHKPLSGSLSPRTLACCSFSSPCWPYLRVSQGALAWFGRSRFAGLQHMSKSSFLCRQRPLQVDQGCGCLVHSLTEHRQAGC